jgi:hypothetical protein
VKNARFSLLVWGIYLFVVGIGFLTIPGTILPALGFAAPVEPWIRVVGILVAILGYLCYRCADANLRPFFPWAVQTRWASALSLAVLVILQLAPVNLLIFAAIDFLGGLWTFLALRAESAPRLATS